MRRSAAVLAEARSRDLQPVVADRHIIVCTGAGGVGKTTTAAALALLAARQGRRAMVLTIDPARRLAQSLGLHALDDTPREVPGAGANGGSLEAMMLDMKRTFDAVVERHAESREQAERITANRFYQQLSSTLAGTQEYMAMEKLFDLHAADHYDCIVIDTPPTRNALDFLDAPRRLTDFLEGRLLRIFLAPGMRAGRTVGRAVGAGAGVFMRAASRITGAAVLSDLAEFFQSFEGMYEGFKERAQRVYKLLQSNETGFVVVTTPEGPALREAHFFLQRLAEDGMPTAGVVVNRATPPAPGVLADLDDAAAAAAAEQLAGGSPADRAAAGLLALHRERNAVALRERRSVAAGLHGTDPHTLVEVPLLPSDVHDLDTLAAVGRWLATPSGAAGEQPAGASPTAPLS